MLNSAHAIARSRGRLLELSTTVHEQAQSNRTWNICNFVVLGLSLDIPLFCVLLCHGVPNTDNNDHTDLRNLWYWRRWKKESSLILWLHKQKKMERKNWIYMKVIGKANLGHQCYKEMTFSFGDHTILSRNVTRGTLKIPW